MNNIKGIIIGICLSFIWGQTPTSISSDLRKNESPIRLKNIKIDVQITGFLAKTSIHMTIYNPNKRQMEGEIILPLPDGATVSGYALDVGGQMVDGVIVEKQKARMIFEQETKRKVDPGLVEHVEGNRYRMRVYPIMPKKTRQCRIEYVQVLPIIGSDLIFKLPLHYPTEMDSFSLNISTSAIKNRMEIKSSLAKRLTTKNLKNTFLWSLQENDFSIEEILELEIPHSLIDPIMVNDEGYFIASGQIPMAKNDTKPLPNNHITLIWDASASRMDDLHKREISIIKEWLNGLDHSIVDLIVFNNIVKSKVSFDIHSGQSQDLLQTLEDLEYDGGTSMQAIMPVINPSTNYIVFVGDGLDTIEPNSIPQLQIPVFILSSSLYKNALLLQSMANKTGGRYIPVTEVDSSKNIAAIIGDSPYHLISISSPDQNAHDVYPSQLAQGENSYQITGKLSGNTAEILLNFGYGAEISDEVRLDISPQDRSQSKNISRFWAQTKLALLMGSSGDNKNKILSLGREYGIVTPGTSLLVLETLAQYLEHKVEPPSTWDSMYKKYMARIKQRGQKNQQSLKQRVKRVENIWKKRLKWFETDFSIKKSWSIKSSSNQNENSNHSSNHNNTENQSSIQQQTSTVTPHIPQGLPGDIGGIVINDNKFKLAGVRIVLTSPNQANDRFAITNEHGEYLFSNLNESNYTITATLSGYLTQRKEIQSSNEHATTTNFHFFPAASIDEAIVVVAERPSLFVHSSSRRSRRNTTANAPSINNDLNSPPPPPAIQGYILDGVQTTSPVSQDYTPKTAIKPWKSKSKYIKKIRKKKTPDEQYMLYLDLRDKYKNSPSFYLDCGHFFAEQKEIGTARMIYTSILDLFPQNSALMRALAKRLELLGDMETAIHIFKQVLKLRSDEAHSYRDLALSQDRLALIEKIPTIQC